MDWKKGHEEKVWGTVIIGYISHICWEQACRECYLLKCYLQQPGPRDSQHSEWFGWGQWGLTQSKDFYYGRQGIQITHIQHKHGGRASDRVEAQHERQISGDIERKLDVGKGTVGKLAGGCEGMRERRYRNSVAMVNKTEQQKWKCYGRKRVDGMIKRITNVVKKES